VHSAGQLNAGAIIIQAAWEEAFIDGHAMFRLEPDVDVGSYIAQCKRCLGWLGSDIAYGLEPYGKVYQAQCPGPPPVPPAERRSEHLRAAAQATGGGERADFHPTIDYRLNWADPERNLLS